MKTLVVCVLLSGISFAQMARVTDIQQASGFLTVCGQDDDKMLGLSAAQAEAVKNAPPSKTLDTLTQQMANRMAEVAMCYGYLAGLIDGWKEGHEHGVIAAQFPDAWPKDEKKALSTLPLKQLQAASAAMKTDVPCVPDYVTAGQERTIIAKYIREQTKSNAFMNLVPTYRMVELAFQDKFPCPAQATSDSAK